MWDIVYCNCQTDKCDFSCSDGSSVLTSHEMQSQRQQNSEPLLCPIHKVAYLLVLLYFVQQVCTIISSLCLSFMHQNLVFYNIWKSIQNLERENNGVVTIQVFYHKHISYILGNMYALYYATNVIVTTQDSLLFQCSLTWLIGLFND